MKLASWNVNGIRAALGKGFLQSVAVIGPDILCLQEVRASPEQVTLDLPGYQLYWNAAERKGYSGTAVLSKLPPLSVSYGMGVPEHDREGRVITLEFPDYALVNVYTPNSGEALARLEYRTKKWDTAFLDYLKKLQAGKPVIFCGDLNVAHKEIDIYDPEGNRGVAGFTDQERANFDRIIEAGFIDTFRHFNSEGGHYTWWSYLRRARAKNKGWRIDYICISAALLPRLRAAEILPDVMGSDHCPVTVSLD